MGSAVPFKRSRRDWITTETGDWSLDCAIGRDHAQQLVDKLSQDESLHPDFIAVMRSMVKHGKFSGVEAGFFQCLLELAIIGMDARNKYRAGDL